MRRRAFLAVAGVLLLVSGVAPAVAEARRDGCEWTQWGQSAAHNGQACARAVGDLRLLTQLVVDPFAAQEAAEVGGIPVHFPVPLVDNDGNVVVLRKGGSLDQLMWSVQALRWQHGRLVPKWTFTTGWKPTRLGFEAMVQSAMSDDFIYVPGAGGTVFQLAKGNGRVLRRINPFGDAIDPRAFVAGGLSLDARGTLFYNVVRLEDPDAHSWLVRATRERTTVVDYRTLIPGAPQPDDQCYATFPFGQPLPPPPRPDGSPTLPPPQPCLSQRAAINVAPAIGPDGTIVSITRAHALVGGENYGYVVALNPDLSLNWAASLRGRLNDGCGVLTPYGTGPFDCRPGATVGVDFLTNLPPAAGVHDRGSAAPVILPDGSVVYGSRNTYNGFRGHLMKFDSRGHYLGNFDFGWDITPAVYRHDGTYSLFVKNNHYLSGGPFEVTRLDANLNVEWKFTNTETRTCERAPDGTISCVDNGEHPNGFEWCISAPAIDRDGNLYGISEDGNLYVLDRNGQQRAKVFLSKTIASFYTPVSLDSHGRVYAQNNGELYVLG